MSAQIRDIKRWSKTNLFFRSPSYLQGMHFLRDQDCTVTIKHKKCFSDFFISKKSGCSTTIIVFHAALSHRNNLKLPVFSGGRLTAGLDVNKIFVSDPSLYLSNSLKSGWFLGNKFMGGEEAIASTLITLLENLGSERVILFGASAGGFAAILYGLLIKKNFPKTSSIAINAQTNLLKFSKRPICEYFETCWGVNPLTRLSLESLDITYNLSSFSSLEDLPLLYVQNTGDHHLEDHFFPFWESCKSKGALRGKYMLGKWFGDGHIAPPPRQIKRNSD